MNIQANTATLMEQICTRKSLPPKHFLSKNITEFYVKNSLAADLSFINHDVFHLALTGLLGITAPPSILGELLPTVLESVMMCRSLGIEPCSSAGQKIVQLGQIYGAGASIPMKSFISNPTSEQKLRRYIEASQVAIATFPPQVLKNCTGYFEQCVQSLGNHYGHRKILQFPIVESYSVKKLRGFSKSSDETRNLSPKELNDLVAFYSTVVENVRTSVNHRHFDFSNLPELRELSPKDRMVLFQQKTGWHFNDVLDLSTTSLPLDIKESINKEPQQWKTHLDEAQQQWEANKNKSVNFCLPAPTDGVLPVQPQFR